MNPLEALNISSVNELTNEQFINVVNSSVMIPTLIIFYLLAGIIFLIMGLVFVKKSRQTFFWIWFTSMILLLAVILFFMFLPNFAYDTIISPITGAFK